MARTIFLGFFLLFFSMRSFACACSAPPAPPIPAGTQPPSEAQQIADYIQFNADHANIVVRAKVKKVMGLSLDNQTPRFKISIKEIFKGDNLPKQLWVKTGLSSCSVFLKAGEEWVIFMNKDLDINACSGSFIMPIKSNKHDAVYSHRAQYKMDALRKLNASK
jgi:hypothetical protein